MKRQETLAIIIILLILVGLPTATLGYQHWLRPAIAPDHIVDISAAAPEAGGFQPDSVQVWVGETVKLRFTSLDVTHGIAIGPGLGVDLGHVDPGRVKEVTLTFDRPGTYTYYCNSWCSPYHWRMRGIIQVRDPAVPNALPTPQDDPIITALLAEGVDIDATRATDDHSYELAPDLLPSAKQGGAVVRELRIPPELQDAAWRRSHSPAQGLTALTAANPTVAEAKLMNAIAYLWAGTPSQPQLAKAATLYAKNCAACHGQTGGGDGPAAGFTAEEPVAFSDLEHMFTARSDVLYAKVRRGGMGTGMPNFGTLFTPEETWALVDYLWTFSLAADQ
ncbi:MAG TPA: c-type cytochrome [Anaerolineae bacterium]|nr:c-type cytochrome [Anaerolineae bacterium]HIQ06021.1 c-type cytochrome [Anaerolineae bacterium]